MLVLLLLGVVCLFDVSAKRGGPWRTLPKRWCVPSVRPPVGRSISDPRSDHQTVQDRILDKYGKETVDIVNVQRLVASATRRRCGWSKVCTFRIDLWV
jgi:hypothetical protein